MRKGKSDVDVALGKFIRRQRQRAQMSQSHLAAILGIHQSGIARIESGDQIVSFAEMLLLSTLLEFGLTTAGKRVARIVQKMAEVKHEGRRLS